MHISSKIETNKKIIKKIFKNSAEIVFKDFLIANKLPAVLVYTKTVTDVFKLSEFVLLPCTKLKKLPNQNVLEHIKNNVILMPEIEEKSLSLEIAEELARGKALLFVEGFDTALILFADKYYERALSEPPTSAVIKGPRKGFNENVKTNLAITRKIITSPTMHSTKIVLGKVTKTEVHVVYLTDIANQEIVNKITDKIKLINIDGIIDSYYIAQYLEERPKSMFKQVGSTEKPDVVAAKLLEGRVAVFVDGSPIVLTLPFVLIEDFQSPDDYYNQQYRVIAIRILRFISVFLTISLPAIYISIQLFHYRAVPLRFIVTIMNSTQGLPFTPFTEILVIIVLFEILYEASLRMPKYLGLALSIVGALILGDTAVKAGLISPPAVMVVAVSGITIYTIPEQSAQLSMLRLFFTIAGGLLGFYGLILLAVFIVTYLSDFDNYGAPYLSPLTPKIKHDMQDAVFKTDIRNRSMRPKAIPNKNSKRAR